MNLSKLDDSVAAYQASDAVMNGFTPLTPKLAPIAVSASGVTTLIAAVITERILDRDALKPWRHQSWLFPRDPRFAEQAGRVPDRYAGRWTTAAATAVPPPRASRRGTPP